MMRTRIPRFRVPEEVIDEEINYVLKGGVQFRGSSRVTSLKAMLADGWDAVFIGTGAPRGLDLQLPGRNEASANIHIGIEWLANIWFQHIHRVGRRVVVIGGGNTALDCARSALRLGGKDVSIVVRSSAEDMKATEWEKQEVLREGATILNDLVPKEFVHYRGQLKGVRFEPVKTVYENGQRALVPTGAPLQLVTCDDVIIAAGQETAFSWIERDLGIEFDQRGLPKLDVFFQSTRPSVFFGGDAAFGPKNIITAVAQGHEAAISIDLFLSGQSVKNRPSPRITMSTRKSPAIVEYNPGVSPDGRFTVPLRSQAATLSNIKAEVELGFDLQHAIAEAGRCLNCDLETVFTPRICVECKACENVCPTDCITFTKNGEEDELRRRLKAPAENPNQDLYVAGGLVSGRVMVKNEDVCLHCGLCAQNCPTGAWQMQPFLFEIPFAGEAHMTASLGATKHG